MNGNPRLQISRKLAGRGTWPSMKSLQILVPMLALVGLVQLFVLSTYTPKQHSCPPVQSNTPVPPPQEDPFHSEKWKAGIANEINFHRAYVRGDFQKNYEDDPNGFYAKEWRAKLAGVTVPEWIDLFCPVLHQEGVRLQLALDHGAGPLSQLGREFECPTADVGTGRVIAVDPLAPLYHRLLNEFNMYSHDHSRTMYCPSEMLLKCFDVETFDFVTVFNALDHSNDAVLGFKNSVSVLKKGGISCVTSIRNEASREKNADFHQWNLDIRDGVFKFENIAKGINLNMEVEMAGRIIRVHTRADANTFTVCYKKLQMDHSDYYPLP